MTDDKQRRRPVQKAAPSKEIQNQPRLQQFHFHSKSDDPIGQALGPLVPFLRKYARPATALEIVTMLRVEDIERPSEADRKYFEKHPDEKAYIRAPLPGEMPLHALAYPPGREPRIVCINHAPGFRSRMSVTAPTNEPAAKTLKRTLRELAIRGDRVRGHDDRGS
jgi:hypothetical protein